LLSLRAELAAMKNYQSRNRSPSPSPSNQLSLQPIHAPQSPFHEHPLHHNHNDHRMHDHNYNHAGSMHELRGLFEIQSDMLLAHAMGRRLSASFNERQRCCSGHR
jgi:hypothetical protein